MSKKVEKKVKEALKKINKVIYITTMNLKKSDKR